MQRFHRYAGLMSETFGRKPDGAVRAAEALTACWVQESQGKLESANAVRILCSQIFRFAIALGRADSDPVAARDVLARTRSVSHAAVTDPEDVGRLMRAIRAETGGSDLVLYIPTTASGAVAKNAFNDALRKLGYTSSQHVHHRFRTAASTKLNEMD